MPSVVNVSAVEHLYSARLSQLMSLIHDAHGLWPPFEIARCLQMKWWHATSHRELNVMQVAAIRGNLAEDTESSTVAVQHGALGVLIDLLRDLALSTPHKSRRLGFQVVLPSICSLLGPSLIHEHFACQLTGIFEAAGQSRDTGASLKS
jgi:hypothetical protein